MDFVGKVLQFIVTGILIILCTMVYADSHEHVHKTSCQLFGGVWNRTHYTGGTCTGSIDEDYKEATLDTVNEMISSIVNIIIFLVLTIFCYVWFEEVIKWKEKNSKKDSQNILQS